MIEFAVSLRSSAACSECMSSSSMRHEQQQAAAVAALALEHVAGEEFAGVELDHVRLRARGADARVRSSRALISSMFPAGLADDPRRALLRLGWSAPRVQGLHDRHARSDPCTGDRRPRLPTQVHGAARGPGRGLAMAHGPVVTPARRRDHRQRSANVQPIRQVAALNPTGIRRPPGCGALRQLVGREICRQDAPCRRGATGSSTTPRSAREAGCPARRR